MKNSQFFSTSHLNSSLKRENSLKNATLLKLGFTVNTINTNNKQKSRHHRTKTDQFRPDHTASTTSVIIQSKLKHTQRAKKQSKKSDTNLNKVSSFKNIQTNRMKHFTIYKQDQNSKQRKDQSKVVKSLQKLRKDLNKTNPQLAQWELRQMFSQAEKTMAQNYLANQYYLLSMELLNKMKNMQKNHELELNQQRVIFQKRQHKLIKKVMEKENKNLVCSALINRLRMKNIDIDGIWHQQKMDYKNKN